MDEAQKELTSETYQHVKRWRCARDEVAQAKSRLNSAECELRNSVTALGKWLTPVDAKRGEKFCVWFGDNLLEVNALDPLNSNYEITLRTRGKHGLY